MALLRPSQRPPRIGRDRTSVRRARTRWLFLSYTHQLTFVSSTRFPFLRRLQLNRHRQPRQQRGRRTTPVGILPRPHRTANRGAINLLNHILTSRLRLTRNVQSHQLHFNKRTLRRFFNTFRARAVSHRFGVFHEFNRTTIDITVNFTSRTRNRNQTILRRVNGLTRQTTVVTSNFTSTLIALGQGQRTRTIRGLSPTFRHNQFWHYGVNFVDRN